MDVCSTFWFQRNLYQVRMMGDTGEEQGEVERSSEQEGVLLYYKYINLEEQQEKVFCIG